MQTVVWWEPLVCGAVIEYYKRLGRFIHVHKSFILAHFIPHSDIPVSRDKRPNVDLYLRFYIIFVVFFLKLKVRDHVIIYALSREDLKNPFKNGIKWFTLNVIF